MFWYLCWAVLSLLGGLFFLGDLIYWKHMHPIISSSSIPLSLASLMAAFNAAYYHHKAILIVKKIAYWSRNEGSGVVEKRMREIILGHIRQGSSMNNCKVFILDEGNKEVKEYSLGNFLGIVGMTEFYWMRSQKFLLKLYSDYPDPSTEWLSCHFRAANWKKGISFLGDFFYVKDGSLREPLRPLGNIFSERIKDLLLLAERHAGQSVAEILFERYRLAVAKALEKLRDAISGTGDDRPTKSDILAAIEWLNEISPERWLRFLKDPDWDFVVDYREWRKKEEGKKKSTKSAESAKSRTPLGV
ncbi:hypothetical protein HYV44_00740 [Candidatus Microgenomates bacterium]|nr:hypothetical protein [Candidatus Microgenomates bacterium]